MKYKTIGILGGSGFVGRHLSALLASKGYQVHILSRNPLKHHGLSLIQNLNIATGDVFDNSTLEEFCQHKDVIINLVGILNEPKDNGQEFHRVHVDLAHHVVHACEVAHTSRLLHMSALNADSDKGSSYYLRSKGEAEDFVLHAGEWGLHVTAFRPSVIFGHDDQFLNRFAGLLRLLPFAFPLACPQSRLAPVYIGDVCDAFLSAMENPESYGKTYELCGPQAYSLKQLVQYTAQQSGLKRLIIGLPGLFSRMQARMLGLLPTKPFTMDNYRSLQANSICTSNGLEELGITAHSIESTAPRYLANDSYKGHLNSFRSQRPFAMSNKHEL